MIKKLLAILFLLIMVIGFVVPGVLADVGAADKLYEVNEDNNIDTSVTLADDGLMVGTSGGATTVILRSRPLNGRITPSDLYAPFGGEFKYEPNGNWYGSDTFTYVSSNGTSESPLRTVTIKVNPVNDPVGFSFNGETKQMEKGSSFSLDLRPFANDLETSDDRLSYQITHQEDTAKVSCTIGSTYMLTCTSASNLVFDDSITQYNLDVEVTVTDTALTGEYPTSSRSTLNMVVLEDIPTTPDARNDAVETNKNTLKVISVLANDIDADGETITLESPASFASTQGGVVTLDDNATPTNKSDDKLKYTPKLDFVGTDTFTYTVSDGALTDTATVTVTVLDPSANLSEYEKTYNEYSDQLDTYDDDYYDFKDDYERADDRNNQDDLEDAEKDLEDLSDDLEKLLDDANDLVDDIEKADDSKYDNLEDDAKDMVDDIESVLDRIERLLNPTTETVDFYTDDVQTAAAPRTTSGSITINQLPPEVLANVGPINQPEETTSPSPFSNSLILLLVGILIVMAVIIFMVVILMKR